MAPEYVIQAPEKFLLDSIECHDALVAFLEKLRAAFLASDRTVCIDFRRTKKMVAGGTLLFYSELRRLTAMFPKVSLRCTTARDDTVNQVLKHLGIFDLCRHSVAIQPTRPDVVQWKVATSVMVSGAAVGEVVQEYESVVGENVKHLFRGVSEAMTNSVNHAFEAPRHDGLPEPPEHRWWMFCREDAQQLVVAVCDLGIGITRSLKIKYADEALAAAIAVWTRGKKPRDALMIHAAMEIARTRTNTPGRGKGLADLRRIVDAVKGGALYLFSNKGLVRYSGGSYSRTNYRRSILGTLVVWLLPLPNRQDD